MKNKYILKENLRIFRDSKSETGHKQLLMWQMHFNIWWIFTIIGLNYGNKTANFWSTSEINVQLFKYKRENGEKSKILKYYSYRLVKQINIFINSTN